MEEDSPQACAQSGSAAKIDHMPKFWVSQVSFSVTWYKSKFATAKEAKRGRRRVIVDFMVKILARLFKR